jgi:hypothetical protein
MAERPHAGKVQDVNNLGCCCEICSQFDEIINIRLEDGGDNIIAYGRIH